MTFKNIIRRFLICLALLGCQHASANAYKCRMPDGKVVISSAPCDEQAKTVSVYQREQISLSQRQAAIDDLNRQKAFVARAESSRQVELVQVSRQANGRASDVDACLMKVTSTFGLSPNQEAGRKVDCYAGTQSLADDCERSVAATMRLPGSSEQYYRARCRQISR